MRNTKRTYKDSLFRDIFNNADRLPEIYEALLDCKTTPDDITLATNVMRSKATVSLSPKYENVSRMAVRSKLP